MFVGLGSDVLRSFGEWHWFLAPEWGWVGGVDFDLWTCFVLLIMSLHMVAMDRCDGDASRGRGMTPVLDCMGLVDPWLGNTELNYALALVALCILIGALRRCTAQILSYFGSFKGVSQHLSVCRGELNVFLGAELHREACLKAPGRV